MDIFVLYNILLVLSISAGMSDSCGTGRIYVGTVNCTYPEQVTRNGIYLLEPGIVHQNRPVYRHETRQQFLYFISSDIQAQKGFWVVGDEVGSNQPGFSAKDPAASPDLIQATWRVYNSATSSWVWFRKLKATCVDDHFMTCTTGSVRLSGLSSWAPNQRHRMGVYELTNITNQMRPVYQHTSGLKEYLFYTDGMWLVGPTIGHITGGMFAMDYAWRPEHIVSPWIVFNGQMFRRDHTLHMSCIGTAPVRNATDDIHTAEDGITNVLPGNLPVDDNATIPICVENTCLHSSLCSESRGSFFCRCSPGYFGPRCETELTCGPPPEITNGNLLSVTGTGYQDVAFYACAGDYRLSGEAAVCLPTGIWSSPPTCDHWFGHITPSVPGGIRRRSRFGINLAGSRYNRRGFRT